MGDSDLWMRFEAERRLVHRQIASLTENGLSQFHNSRIADPAAKLPGLPTPGVRETWFLHGSKPDRVLSILNGGLNDRVASSAGTFGAGIYLAEDIEKADQYAQPDADFEAPGMEELHSRLFRAGGNTHPGEDLFYCFVVRGICGLQLCSTGLQRLPPGQASMCDEETGQQLFMTEDRRELVQVPGSSPPVSHHSMVCGLGKALKRFREFVIYDANRTYPEYLVAYKRIS